MNSEEVEFFKNIIEQINKSTLGKLLKQIRNIVHFDNSALKMINDALDCRNYLFHNFFRTHNFAIFIAKGRMEMISDLKDIQSKLNLAIIALVNIGDLIDKISDRQIINEKDAQNLMTIGRRIKI